MIPMKDRNNTLMTCIAILLLTIAISGCTDSENKNSSTPQTSTGDEIQNKEQDTVNTDIKTELKNIFSKKDSLEYKVSHTTKLTGTGEQKMTQYIKGENMRVDMIIEDIETRTYILGTSSMYTCSKPEGEWSCIGFDTPQESSTSDQALTDFTEETDLYEIKYLSTRNIAGTSAKCFSMKNTAENVAIEYCISPEGVPLYTKTTMNEITMEMTATSYSTSVSDSDFTLPAEPVDMSNLMGNMASDPCSICDMLPEESRQECLDSCSQ